MHHTRTEHYKKYHHTAFRKSFQQRGVSFVEYAIASPILLFLFLGGIDLGRYFYISTILNYSAYYAADYAAKKQIEADTRGVVCESTPEVCTKFQFIINKIVDKTINHVLTPMISGPLIRNNLITYQHYRSEDYPQAQYPTNRSAYSLTPTTFPIAILRPGEVVHGEDGSSYAHPFRGPFNSSDASSGWPRVTDGEQWEQILREIPIVVHIEAHFQPILPFFSDDIKIRATQVAYRRFPNTYISEPGIAGTPGSAVTPSPSATATLVVPVPTPGGPPTPTATPTRTPEVCPANPCLANRCACRWFINVTRAQCDACEYLWPQCNCGD